MAGERKSLERARLLAEKVSALPESDSAALQGASSAKTVLLDVRLQAAKLVASMQNGDSPDEQERQLKKLDGAFRTAQLFNIISANELTKYLDELEDICSLMNSGS